MHEAPAHRPSVGRLVLAVFVSLSALAWLATERAEAQTNRVNGPGAVYSMTNDAGANSITRFERAADGTLSRPESFPTGGTGTGTVEDSDNSLVLANVSGESSPINLRGTARLLFATNAGSDTVSVFRVEPDGLELVDVQASGGDRPISVTVSKGVAYVMNTGGFMCSGTFATGQNVTGFTLDAQGELEPIPGSARPLVGGPLSGCTQASFDKTGNVLVVNEQQFDLISTYTRNQDGTLNGPTPQQSTGNGPFGATFTQRNQLITTENFGAAPGQGGAASYEIDERTGTLTPIGPTERNGQSDTCWVVITEDNKFAFTTSFGDNGSISTYRVENDGDLTLLNPGEEDSIGTGAADLALDRSSRYMYAKNSFEGTVTVFRIENDGDLTRMQEVRDGSLTGGSIGIAAQ